MRVIEVSPLRPLCVAALAVATFVLFGCTTTPNRAPVEDRMATPRAAVSASAPTTPAPATPVAEPPKPAVDPARAGYYIVKPGDTLIRIGLDTGQNWKDLVRWNNLENPNVIEVGQSLRVVAPGVDPAPRRAARSPRRAPRPGRSIRPGPAPRRPQRRHRSPRRGHDRRPRPHRPAPHGAREGDDDITWSWPAARRSRRRSTRRAARAGVPRQGRRPGARRRRRARRLCRLGPARLRQPGDPQAQPDLPHRLRAQPDLLVKDDQNVKRGQKIAEMGSTDADGVQLHFEIRKQGKPIDPARLLPPR
jgi:lipoprotein NlpD